MDVDVSGGAHASRLLLSLERLTSQFPLARKRLIGPDMNFGRELLVALAQRTGGWIGWEAENLRGVARELAFVPLGEKGVRVAGDLELGLLVNRALTRLVDARKVSGAFMGLSRSLGFRRSLRDAILELRTAAVTPAALRAKTRPGSPANDLASVLEGYEALLREEHVADPAELFRVALESFEQEAPFVLDGEIAIVPTLALRGLPGELLARLLARGAHVLDIDVPLGIAAPPNLIIANKEARASSASLLAWASATDLPGGDCSLDWLDRTDVDLFASATPTNEIREICRRVVAEGLRWEEVEIIATDPDTYGVALDALCQRTGVSATMLDGVPLARTRIGRALDRWFTWLTEGLPADVLRQALEAGEVNVDGFDLASTALARELRAHQIGWGRARYAKALDDISSGKRVDSIRRYEDEDDESFVARRTSREKAAKAVGVLLTKLLGVIPPVPERGSNDVVKSSCARLAKATLSYLDLIPPHGQAEEQTAARLRSSLQLLAELHDEEVGFLSAMAALREAIIDTRAWPLQTNDRKPWSASGGMLHLTDVGHGGTTGRRRIFVVGLDAGRTGGVGRQDPLLPDEVRHAVAPGALATVAERRAVGAYALGCMLASLRGRVTLSYSTSSDLDGRDSGASPLLLQAHRLQKNDASVTYEVLRQTLLPPASPVPLGAPLSGGCIDGRDVWMQAMVDGGLLLDASRPLGTGFPELARGLSAWEHSNGEELTPFHGYLPEAGELLDLLASAGKAISPSALEQIAKCPLSWFYSYGLRLRTPSDPEFDVARWLDEAQRGSLLHEVYERFAREYAAKQNELASDTAKARMQEVARAVIAEWRVMVPPPGEAVFDRERGELERSALAFLELERARRAGGDEGTWVHFEFGFGDETRPAATYVLEKGKTLTIRGKADRIDLLPNATLRVVDYKTGSSGRFGRQPKNGAFNGGRLLQPALYAAAITGTDGKSVSEFEYRFPTPRGQNEVVTYAASELEAARPIIASLVEDVRAGRFLPTMDSSDCKFCNHQPICRAVEDRYSMISPRAEWAALHGSELAEYESMRQRRGVTSSEPNE